MSNRRLSESVANDYAEAEWVIDPLSAALVDCRKAEQKGQLKSQVQKPDAEVAWLDALQKAAGGE